MSPTPNSFSGVKKGVKSTQEKLKLGFVGVCSLTLAAGDLSKLSPGVPGHWPLDMGGLCHS